VKVRIVSVTRPLIPEARTAEELIVYCARVSNPSNQANMETAEKLLQYCIREGHWSVFDMADMTVEVQTSRALSAQTVRHWSFDGIEVAGDFRFQEFSQRYAEVPQCETYEARAPHPKNRQLSVDTLPDETKAWFRDAQRHVQSNAHGLYTEALSRGIAKECARFLLPMAASTTYYMKGAVRSWLFYLEKRALPENGAQPEHLDIGQAIMPLFREHFPIVSAAYFGAK
jgi:thymidylate synthase (FAD)